MSTLTREQVLECLTKYVPLGNFFLLGEENEIGESIMYWHPQIGLRYLIIEKDDLGLAALRFLREVGVRRFKSELEVSEAMRSEKWEGWDTCADYIRIKKSVEELAKKSKKRPV